MNDDLNDLMYLDIDTKYQMITLEEMIIFLCILE